MDALWKSTTGSSDTSSPQSSQSLLNDKLIEKIIYMALPASNDLATASIENRLQAGAARPGLSVPIMSRNFIQLNSRLGIPFMILDDVISIFNWTNPSYTLCILSFYSFLVLKPLPTLVSGPIVYILFGIMSPTYMDIHKPTSDANLGNNPVPARGPPLKDPRLPAPVQEFSKEFILNLTDLQNHMTLYVMAYDFIYHFLSKFAYFQNESISSAVFLALLFFSCLNALTIDTLSVFIPWKFIFLSLGWAFVISLHPKLRDIVFNMIYSEETRLRILTSTNQIERKIYEQFDLYEPTERREASIFELQKFNQDEKTWELIGFSTSDYTIFSDARINEIPTSQIATTLLLDEVKPPVDWEWLVNFDWTLDLHPAEWVSSGFIPYVEVDTETKWVYDTDLDGSRGQYRRRRWIKLCTREKQFSSQKKTDNASADLSNDEESGNPNYNGYTAITQNSFSGGDVNVDKDTDKAKGTRNTKKVDDNNSGDSSGLVTSASVLSLSSSLSQGSGDSQKTSFEKSKAIKSLTDLLNITT